MGKDFMNMTEKIEQRRSEVEEALKEEAKTIDQALTKLKNHLTEKITEEVILLKSALEQQENEHYQAIKLHLQAIEQALGIQVLIKKNKTSGKLFSEVHSLKEKYIDKIKFWEK